MNKKSKEMAKPPGIGFTLVLGSLAINLLSLALPLVLLQIFDRIIPNAATQTLTVLFCGLILALGMELVLKLCRIVLLAHSSARYEVDLTVSACAKILDTEAFAFSRDSAGTHSDRLAAIGQLRDHYCGQGRLLAIDMPFAALFIALIWYIAGWLVLVPFVCLALILIVSVAVRFLQAPVLAKRQSIDRRRNSFMMEVLSHVTTVKALAAEDQMLRRFELLQVQSAEATRGLILVASLSQSLGAILGQAAVVMMAGFGAYLNITGAIGMAELAACMLLNGRTIQPMLKLLGIWAQQESLIAAEKKLEELATLPEYPATKKTDVALEPSLLFKDVTLHPKGREKPVFANVSFVIETGQFAALVGPDGGGKSSIMRMILGEQGSMSGEIFIGKARPEEMRDKRNVGEIAYVDQEPVIFKGTILENLALFGGRVREDAAIHMSQKIGLEAEILRMPLGYETEIGPGAQTVLPLGTQQKIALARVLGRRPSLLLFNNAASAIDGNSRANVASTLRALKGQTTVLLVSQTLLEDADIDVNIDISNDDVAGEESASLRAWLADAEADRQPIRLRPKLEQAK